MGKAGSVCLETLLLNVLLEHLQLKYNVTDEPTIRINESLVMDQRVFLLTTAAYSSRMDQGQ